MEITAKNSATKFCFGERFIWGGKYLAIHKELGHASIKVIFNTVSNSRLKAHSSLFY